MKIMSGDTKLWQLFLLECVRCVPWLVTGVTGAWQQVWSEGGSRCGPSGARGVPRVAVAADTLMVGATYSPLITSAGGWEGACRETGKQDMSAEGRGSKAMTGDGREGGEGRLSGDGRGGKATSSEGRGDHFR